MSRTEVVNLPAIAEQDEWIDGELFRRAGEALCPQLKSLEYLRQLEADMGPWLWRTMQQGDPTAPEGFEWPPQLFGEQIYVSAMPKALKWLVIACDPATGKKPKVDRTDYTAVIALGTTGDGNLYFDGIMERCRFDGAKRNLLKMWNRLPRKADLIGIEATGFQDELRIQANRFFSDNGITVPVVAVESTLPKHLRIRNLDPQISAGQVRFVDNKDMRLVAQQFMSFPHPHAHDDGPDACELAVRIVKQAVELYRGKR